MSEKIRVEINGEYDENYAVIEGDTWPCNSPDIVVWFLQGLGPVSA